MAAGSAPAGPNYLADAFKFCLRDAEYVEGRNLTIEYRWMGGREKDYPNVADELTELKVDAIVTAGHPAALAAKNATSLIPIIALAVVDPVGSGLAESLSHPGGNVTGFSLETSPQTNAKMIQLLSDAVSGVGRVGVLWNSANPGSRVYLDIVDMAHTARLPTIYGWRAATEIGGLMSYGPDLIDLFKRGAGYVDRPPAPAADHNDPPPSGIRSTRSGLQRSRLPSGLGGNSAQDSPWCRTTHCGETRSPASAAARAPRAED